MNIQIVGSGIEIDAKIKKEVDTKIAEELDKLLQDFAEDLKIAHMKIEKLAHGGFSVNFDMRLPGGNGHIFSEETGYELLNVLIALRREVEGQIKQYKDKLQDYR